MNKILALCVIACLPAGAARGAERREMSSAGNPRRPARHDHDRKLCRRREIYRDLSSGQGHQPTRTTGVPTPATGLRRTACSAPSMSAFRAHASKSCAPGRTVMNITWRRARTGSNPSQTPIGIRSAGTSNTRPPATCPTRLSDQAASRLNASRIAAPISTVVTCRIPSDMMSPVRRPAFSTSDIAASSLSASPVMLNE